MAAVNSSQLESAVAAFVEEAGTRADIAPLGDGNINDTFLIRFHSSPSLVLQRINASVFPDPLKIAANSAVVSRHLQSRIPTGFLPDHGFRFPQTVRTVDGRDCFTDDQEDIWRCHTYIDNSVVYQSVTSGNQAFEAGRMLGFFHRSLASLDHQALDTPLPGFHDFQRYRQAYLGAVPVHQRTVSARLEYCLEMAEQHLEEKTLDELAASEGGGRQVIHGDPKCDNFLFDTDSDRVVSLIDLDTTAPGLIAVDVGDCLRSFCNPGGEKTKAAVSFDIDVCRHLIEGYRSAGALSPAESCMVYHGVRMMTCELGLRFLTDYLENDRYFKVTDKEENLHRAVVQFRLLESIEAQRRSIETIAGC